MRKDFTQMENKNQQNEKKSNNRKANRILYMALAAVLCAGAIVTGVLLSRKDSDTVLPEEPVDVTPIDTPAVVEEDPTLILPEFMAPAVGLVTKGHDLDVLVYSTTTDDWRVHRGIDISASVGDAVMAAADGVVSAIEDDPLMGLSVTIRHNGNAVTIYRNLSAELAEGIAVGGEVRCGQTIGCIGESAMLELSDEPHLHFELMVAGEAVDPMDFISADSAAASLAEDISYEG
jgi:murein DD-endopeptidase MepM/ murein hydrolase activator NlpD